jgi:hypothetical protein
MNAQQMRRSVLCSRDTASVLIEPIFPELCCACHELCATERLIDQENVRELPLNERDFLQSGLLFGATQTSGTTVSAAFETRVPDGSITVPLILPVADCCASRTGKDNTATTTSDPQITLPVVMVSLVTSVNPNSDRKEALFHFGGMGFMGARLMRDHTESSQS